jgi:hypothetical protein
MSGVLQALSSLQKLAVYGSNRAGVAAFRCLIHSPQVAQLELEFHQVQPLAQESQAPAVFSHLRQLSIHHTSMWDDSGLRRVAAACPHLQMLQLPAFGKHASCTADWAEALAPLTQLRRLTLGSLVVSERLWFGGGALPALEELELRLCDGVNDASLALLAGAFPPLMTFYWSLLRRRAVLYMWNRTTAFSAT